MEEQIIMGDHALLETFIKHSPLLDSLIVPAYICVISSLLLLLHVLLSFNPVRKLFTRAQDTDNTQPEHSDPAAIPPTGLKEGLIEHVRQLGGGQTFTYMALQLVGTLALFALSATSFLIEEMERNHSGKKDIGVFGKWGKKHKKKHHHGSSVLTTEEWLHAGMCMVYAYTSLLALVSVTVHPRWSRIASRHLVSVLLATFVVYAYRNIWPLATFNLTPRDAREGWVMWGKVGLLALVSIVIPLVTPRQYAPVDPKHPMTEANPEQTASLFSLLTYSFLNPVVFLAYRLPHLSHTQLSPLADWDHAAHLTTRAFPHLDPFSGAKRRHLFFGLMRVFHTEYMILAVMITIQVIAGFLSPIGINKLLEFLESGGKGNIRPWVFISWLFVGPMVGSMALQWYIFIATRTLVRAECIITQLVFEHSLRIRMKAETPQSDTTGNVSSGSLSASASLVEVNDHSSQVSSSGDETVHPPSVESESTQTSQMKTTVKLPPKRTEANLVGRITNLVTTDLGNIVEGRDFLIMVLAIPVQVTLCLVFLYRVLGASAFAGLATMIITFPIPGFVARLINKVQVERLKTSDARVETVTETLQTIRMSKLFGWGEKMNKRIQDKREAELQWLWKRQILDLVNGSCNFVIPLAVMVVTFGTYTLIAKGQLNASKVYSSLSVFDILREQLHFAVYALTQVVQAKVSLDRVDDFLNNTELLDTFESDAKTPAIDISTPQNSEIGFNDASFVWSNEASNGTMTPSRRNFRLDIKGKLTFKRGAINLIVGPTGSGKTSLLMGLLSEMHFVPTGVDSWYSLPRARGVAYAAQESWVQSESIRENILFGSPYDEERYNKVIYQTGMQRDLTLFTAGDLTEVGEKGLTLSGGQKARITLARAIYSPAEILLLDDILAALDVHTAKWIIDECFTGDLIKDRTVLLVTHNVAMTASIADFVVSLGLDGTISSSGSPDEAISKDATLAAEVVEEQIAMTKAEQEIDPVPPPTKPAHGRLVLDEEIAEGHVSWKALRMYLSGMGGNHAMAFFSAVVLGLMGTQILNVVETWYLGRWASQYEIHYPSEVNVAHYLGFYCSLLLASVAIYCVSFLLYTTGTLKASRTIHRVLIESILGTTLRWLDRTPTARVIARCTQDIRTLDGPITQGLFFVLDLTTALITRFSAIIMFTPVFATPVLAIAAAGGWVGQIYMAAQLSVKREMSNAKAPVLSHFGAAIAGLTSIRAYGAQAAFRATSLKRIDLYTKSARTFYNLNRWICVRIDSLGALFASALATYLIYGRTAEATPANTGFEISLAVSVSSMILWWVRVLNEFEVNGNSLERIQEFVTIEQEPKASEQGRPPAAWPTSGDIQVENLSARYSEDGPEVLHDLSFHIRSGERVGIVGRTGSGKSSLTLALLRCILTTGTVHFDGLLTDSVNLDELRSKITIIPQIPELLSGSLRSNVDPFQEYDDATLNDALRASDSAISSGGDNLSVGQRQIIALARAIVRGSKLLILDEATSAIDYKTDSIIQTSLRRELGKDVTLITVAHRLQTIMDADKIMVLDAGKMVEFDHPRELLKKESGLLHALVEQSGDKDGLRAMADGK